MISQGFGAAPSGGESGFLGVLRALRALQRELSRVLKSDYNSYADIWRTTSSARVVLELEAVCCNYDFESSVSSSSSDLFTPLS